MFLLRFPLVFVLAAVLLAGCSTPATVVAPVTAADTPTHDSTVLLVWHREGGIVGFCDDLNVNADGSYTIAGCGSRPKNQRSGQLNASQLQQLTVWATKFQSFDTSRDQGPVAADGMIQAIVFKGMGTAQPGPQDLAAINKFASGLVTQKPGG